MSILDQQVGVIDKWQVRDGMIGPPPLGGGEGMAAKDRSDHHRGPRKPRHLCLAPEAVVALNTIAAHG
jgi:hypothetical protein